MRKARKTRRHDACTPGICVGINRRIVILDRRISKSDAAIVGLIDADIELRG